MQKPNGKTLRVVRTQSDELPEDDRDFMKPILWASAVGNGGRTAAASGVWQLL